MTRYLAAVLTVLALGVMLIAYGLLAPGLLSAEGSRLGGRWPEAALDAVGIVERADGSRVMVYRERGATGREFADVDAPAFAPHARPARAAVVEAPVSAPRRSTGAAARPARTSSVTRPSGRDWKRTALVVAGATAAGAGVGGAVSGGKGALVGAAIGGGVTTLIESTRR